MEEKELQASSFADTIQVSRGAISHIMNGRNKPSKDTIDKILKVFPDISSSWFLRGDGPMYKHERILVQADLFDEKKPVESFEKSQVHEYSLKNEVKKPENKVDSTIIQEIKALNIPAKKIDKIMIFFNDKTFMTFIPEE
jgi:transcriptional regulator with XRE-family HTH domain